MFLIVITTDTIPELIRTDTEVFADQIVQRWGEMHPNHERDTEMARKHAAGRPGGLIPAEAYADAGGDCCYLYSL